MVGRKKLVIESAYKESLRDALMKIYAGVDEGGQRGR